jgi:ribose 5-phosphate isomerase B
VRVAISADHAGLPLRADVADAVTAAGHTPLLLGPDTGEPVDYPDMAALVGEALATGQADRGIVLCGSAAGANVAANQLPLVRSATAHDAYTGHQMVEHDDVNVLTLGARVIGPATATDVVTEFLGAVFSGEERHVRRLRKTFELGWPAKHNGGAWLRRDHGVRLWVLRPTGDDLYSGRLAALIDDACVTGFLEVPADLVEPLRGLLSGVHNAFGPDDGLAVAAGADDPAGTVLRVTAADEAAAASAAAIRHADGGGPVILAVTPDVLPGVVAGWHT